MKTKKIITEEHFPPCIKKGLLGIDDGKKRFLFVLTNFLHKANWTDDLIEKRVKQWNNTCPNPLNEQYIFGHLMYQKQHKTIKVPDCDNNNYYKDLGICFKDSDVICQKITNPFKYVIILRRLNIN